MPSYLFITKPGGACYRTYWDESTNGVTTGDGFYKAHLHAARQAAEHKIPSWVTRDDTGEERYGFGPGAFLAPTTVLYQITQMGLNSYWCDASESWVPMPSAKADAEVSTELETV